MLALAYLQTPPKQTALLKSECADFIVKEELGYEMSGEGEFVAVKVRKTNNNSIYVGEQLAKFARVPLRNMGYAGLKDRKAITEQWFCLQMPGQATPDFSQFKMDGVEILQVTRHHRKIRIGSLVGNYFEILLRNIVETDELKVRLEKIKNFGFPNYFTEQRFGKDGHNLTQAMRWARGEIKVKDRQKRSFYLSAARSEVFNLVVSERIQQGVANQVLANDILQLTGSHSWFVADENEDLAILQNRLAQRDLQLTAPLIGETAQVACQLENQIVGQHQEIIHLMKQQRMKPTRRPVLMQPQNFQWAFGKDGLTLKFYLPAGSYATALVRELAVVDETI
ncbi:tRNA pseudouridine(13) synthase TruD [Pasteurella bettyae]|uniref:tRNA pseudouridine synthase D n=1 Tax=Pasteurella bettyae CCUG 2042 TaxID=1095749 RepID=I3DBB3_9PAST|nr:tRNA pseudouridine(13) synthase TruD [Pasteurella bettyae]EIJ69006.1 tRNA pseudouridine synthase D [Pasteurella bettyae CCUG 2042]SUB22844.1 tRNA pseudouridine synthase D [Pasteurella bettyae]